MEQIFDFQFSKEVYVRLRCRLIRAANIDILYTLDSASNYSEIQKLKPWLQSQVVPIKWEDSYVFYFLNRELKH
jgi:hypothetical protein